MNRTGVLYALASAALFGASTPAAKLLLGTLDPFVLAGLLYCGAGIGVAGLRRLAPAVAPQIPVQVALAFFETTKWGIVTARVMGSKSPSTS